MVQFLARQNQKQHPIHITPNRPLRVSPGSGAARPCHLNGKDPLNGKPSQLFDLITKPGLYLPPICLNLINKLNLVSDFDKEIDRDKLQSARFLSYIDDISITVSSDSLEQKCRLLEFISHYLVRKGQANHIQFDHDKIELIHFFPSRTIDLDDNRFMVQVGEKKFRAKPLVKWLGVHIMWIVVRRLRGSRGPLQVVI
jgi:hypothetical protein